ncbi:ABC-2 type transport system permease protein [Georgenia satyanarayanai]|uniref:ABC-2 type transport system permease protein n=1 Tax=Georgenia satyanarayanai TaxID=860221 RepID=A0A2Y9ARR5_9MICO|nr:hypothetical protein [Georgenia satyanarayanai]PYF98372.1 ABC-2 type transport system permease protein [Georgenia satyanarayanai]SSA44979.1 ABC-2 type transport system permease protein [Georgenia satyanarayanai]
MSAVAALPAPVGLPARSGVTFGRVLASEWSKTWGLRSTRWTVAVMVLLTVGLSYLGGSDSLVGADGYGSLAYFVTSTLVVTQFPILLLGVLLGSGELSSRSAGPTFVAVPTRTPVVLAKALVTTAVAAVTATATLGLAAAAVLLTPLGPELSTALTAETVRMWLGTGAYLVAATVFCFGVGVLLRRSATAVVVAFVVFVVELAQVALPDALRPVAAFLPGHAGTLVTSSDSFVDLLRDIGELPVGPWGSVAVTAAWATLAVVGAAVSLRARDV